MTTLALLPGIALLASDYTALADEVRTLRPGWRVEVLDALDVPVTDPVAHLRDHLGERDLGEPVVLVGHSLGALAAVEWAATRPGEVAGLVLLDPSDPWGDVDARLLPGGPVHRLVRRCFSLVTRVPVAARPLGRSARAGILAASGEEEWAPRDLLARRYGTRAGVLSVWDQLCGRFTQLGRVAPLVERVVAPATVLLAHAPDEDPGAHPLVAALGAAVVPVAGTHCFPCVLPAETARLVVAAVDRG
ncbi:alpha/beta hydrolase [Nocardioides bruguierae]|uniref:alpha/beta hydrolase n=1 Tax=Nocardioides bruguierae TaxID=2945102 RepID=UPI00202136C3|nr:alpha/beta hydrolase [Nocardioides bruguierae]MCL8027449.1 alpha/beta fold hydrolase [Nocardioides bruguierae]